MREWFAAVRGLEREPERGRRCPLCFRFRLEKAFRHAREHAFDAVASTLSISPYKVAAQINEQGLALAREYGVEFLPENFKKHDGFLVAREQAAALGVRQQDYLRLRIFQGREVAAPAQMTVGQGVCPLRRVCICGGDMVD